MPNQRSNLPQGTVDLLILCTLALGPQNGWGISERVQQTSSNLLRIQQGPLDPALHRRQLEVATDMWKKLTGAVAQVLDTAQRLR